MSAEIPTHRWLLFVIAAGAWVLRVSPFFRVDGVLGWPVDYDEGVYVAASALTFRGTFPYRDFVFVHPPGAPLLFGLVTAWPIKPSTMLTAIRIAMTFVGACNVLLLGLIVRRHAGLVGGVLAAILYATYPEAVYAERGAYLEPLLNLACLVFVAIWTSDRPRAAAYFGGLLLLIKSWGLFWIIGALAAAPNRRQAIRLVVTAGFALVPLLFVGDFVEQTLLFHLWRPADGTIERWPRVLAMFLDNNRITALLTLVGLVGLVLHRALPIARLAATALVLIIVAFLASSAWWSQYDAHLALAQALVAGLGCGLLLKSRLQWPAIAVAFAFAIPGIVSITSRRHDRDRPQLERAAAVREVARPGPCAFEAVDLLLADALPLPPVDAYGQMLLDSVRDGARHPSATQAFASEAAQRTIRTQLKNCHLVVLGWRGDWQLNRKSKAEFEDDFSPVRESVFLRK